MTYALATIAALLIVLFVISLVLLYVARLGVKWQTMYERQRAVNGFNAKLIDGSHERENFLLVKITELKAEIADLTVDTDLEDK